MSVIQDDPEPIRIQETPLGDLHVFRYNFGAKDLLESIPARYDHF
jgi:hypothetical protein